MIDDPIRPAQSTDLPTLQAIARRTIDACYRLFLGDMGVDLYLDSGESDREVARHLDHCDVFLEDGAVVAFSIYFDDLIHLMMVDLDRHRTGVGSKLLAHAEAQLFGAGHPVIRVETFEDNEQAVRFYRKHDWTLARREKDVEHGFIRVFLEKRAP